MSKLIDTPAIETIHELFERLDPAAFFHGSNFGSSSTVDDHGPIRTYTNKAGLTLSAISDRRFMAWITASLMPLAGRRVLEIGAGTGYLAYALAQLTGPDGLVEGCEVIGDLYEASRENPLIRSTPWISLRRGDFVDVVPHLGQFDVVIATSAMSCLHPSIVQACRPDGGMIAFPIEIQGGGDCYTIFRLHGGMLTALDAALSVSVPTTGTYSSKPPWVIPIGRIIPDFDAFETIRLRGADDLSHPVYETLAFRSFLQAYEPLFAAVSIDGDRRPFEQSLAFGLIDKLAQSFCLQNEGELLLGGSRSLELAEGFTQRREAWKGDGCPSLADFRYSMPVKPEQGISFLPAIAPEARTWRRS